MRLGCRSPRARRGRSTAPSVRGPASCSTPCCAASSTAASADRPRHLEVQPAIGSRGRHLLASAPTRGDEGPRGGEPMLSRLILLVLQLIVAWFAAPVIVRYIPGMGRLELFVYAAVFAVLVWLVGVVGAQILKDTGTPSSAALASALVVALIAAAIYTWLPAFVP